jgi:thiamine-phosphate pyrophosphorylase
MTSLAPVRGFYAILDADDEALATDAGRPAAARRRVLQVRLKHAGHAGAAGRGAMARRVTAAVGALLIVNDRLDVALAVEADGVHLGQDDLPLEPAQAALGGARAHGDRDLDPRSRAGRAGGGGGADYLGFGPVFATATKANPDPVVGLDGLAARRAPGRRDPGGGDRWAGSRPHAAALHAAGAAAACAISAVNAAADPAAAARALAAPWRGGGA